MLYNDTDLEALLSEVEEEFKSHLSKSESKVESKESTETKEESKELKKSEESDSISYDENDMKEMNELYASMTKSEKEAHYKAIKSVLFENSEEESKEGDKIAKAEDLKVDLNAEVSEDVDIIAKAEQLEKENEELKKSVSKLVTILTEKVKKSSVPKQKAITGVDYIKKSEDDGQLEDDGKTDASKLSKAEVTTILREKARTEDLKKSDRDRINAYVFNEIGIDKIKDLL